MKISEMTELVWRGGHQATGFLLMPVAVLHPEFTFSRARKDEYG
jgi:hypothetical protein